MRMREKGSKSKCSDVSMRVLYKTLRLWVRTNTVVQQQYIYPDSM